MKPTKIASRTLVTRDIDPQSPVHRNGRRSKFPLAAMKDPPSLIAPFEHPTFPKMQHRVKATFQVHRDRDFACRPILHRRASAQRPRHLRHPHNHRMGSSSPSSLVILQTPFFFALVLALCYGVHLRMMVL
jgi:hypothetical protein